MLIGQHLHFVNQWMTLCTYPTLFLDGKTHDDHLSQQNKQTKEKRKNKT
jgi:hypothetical protein